MGDRDNITMKDFLESMSKDFIKIKANSCGTYGIDPCKPVEKESTLIDDGDQITSDVKMTKDEFITKTKSMLTLLEKEYSKCWKTEPLTEEELEKWKSITECDDCKGQCTMTINGKEVEVIADHESGECCKKYFDNESFIEFMENNIIFGDSPFMDLIACRFPKKDDKKLEEIPIKKRTKRADDWGGHKTAEKGYSVKYYDTPPGYGDISHPTSFDFFNTPPLW